jgi:hypothetical protein
VSSSPSYPSNPFRSFFTLLLRALPLKRTNTAHRFIPYHHPSPSLLLPPLLLSTRFFLLFSSFCPPLAKLVFSNFLGFASRHVSFPSPPSFPYRLRFSSGKLVPFHSHHVYHDSSSRLSVTRLHALSPLRFFYSIRSTPTFFIHTLIVELRHQSYQGRHALSSFP